MSLVRLITPLRGATPEGELAESIEFTRNLSSDFWRNILHPPQRVTSSVRIAYLNPCGKLGGAETSLAEMLASVREAEPSWELWLVLGEDGPLAGIARDLGVQVIVKPFPAALARLGDSGTRTLAVAWGGLRAITGTAGYAREVARTLARIRPDIIHTNGFKMHVLASWARQKETPVVWHIRDYVSSRPLMRILLRLHASRCAAAIGNSQSVTEDIQRVCGARLETHCIYNAVDLNRYSPRGGKANLDALSGLPPAPAEVLRIGLIATLARWKGHAVFLRALAQLPDNVVYRAYVIGGAIYQTENSQQTLEELRTLAAQLGIAERVGFTGYMPESADAIRALDIVVHASTAPEPFGRVIAEGMACGRAVICSNAGGARELITDGYDALSHPPGDATALAGRIAELARNPELRAKIGRAARDAAERRFSLSRLAEEVIQLYQRTVRQPAPGNQAELAASR